MPRKKTTAINFEQSITQLNQLVETLEHGDLALEASLKHFARGVELVRACEQALAHAEQQVQILTATKDTSTLQPYETENTDVER